VAKSQPKTLYTTTINGVKWTSSNKEWLENKKKTEEELFTGLGQSTDTEKQYQQLKKQIQQYQYQKNYQEHPTYTLQPKQTLNTIQQGTWGSITPIQKNQREKIAHTTTNRGTTLFSDHHTNPITTWAKGIEEGIYRIPKSIGIGVLKQWYNNEIDSLERTITSARPDLIPNLEQFKKQHWTAQKLYVPKEQRWQDQDLNTARITEVMDIKQPRS